MLEDEFRTFENALAHFKPIQGLVRFTELCQCPRRTGNGKGKLKEDVARRGYGDPTLAKRTGPRPFTLKKAKCRRAKVGHANGDGTVRRLSNPDCLSGVVRRGVEPPKMLWGERR